MIDKSDKKTGKATVAASALWKKISLIQTGAKEVYKDTMATVGGGGSKPVASIESMLNTFLPLCEKHGVTIVPTDDIEILISEFRQTRNGVDALHLVAKMGFRAIDTETGESHTFKILSHGTDTSDKATGKLHTYGLKYAYAQLFSARKSVDDPDVTDEHRREPVKNQRQESQPVREREPGEDDDAGEQESDAEKTARQQLEYKAAVAALKTKWTLKDASDSATVPDLKGEYKTFVASAMKKMTMAEPRKHFADFSLYYWHCLNASGNPDAAKAETAYKKDKGKMTKENAEFVQKIFDRRSELDR